MDPYFKPKSPATSQASGPTAREARGAGGLEMAEPGRKDAVPSNTASDNCKPPSFKALRFGVDSLYLSYPGELSVPVLRDLKALKEKAQSAEPGEVADAQFLLGEHIFEVKDKGTGVFAYTLEDGAFRIQLSKPSKTVPMAYVKVSAGYLAHKGPAGAERALYELLSQIGDIRGEANVSRIDLYVDFVSSWDMESWDREAWVTRAADIAAYAENGDFTGWSIGMGGVMGARLYFKLLEAIKKQNSWVFEAWTKAGWQTHENVWRLEFEFKRDMLAPRGLQKLSQVLRHLDGLWSYATTEWLRLTIPNPQDKTRSRWEIHPLWALLASVDWNGEGVPLVKKFSPARCPEDDKLLQLGSSTILSFMAKHGFSDLGEGGKEFLACAVDNLEKRAYAKGLSGECFIQEQLALKRRLFNVALNNSQHSEELDKQELEEAARAYRKASGG